MTSKHLSEEEIQQWALDKTKCGTEVIAHMHDCENCRAGAETYHLLFAEIKQMPNPVFDFNVPGLVLQVKGEPVAATSSSPAQPASARPRQRKDTLAKRRGARWMESGIFSPPVSMTHVRPGHITRPRAFVKRPAPERLGSMEVW